MTYSSSPASPIQLVLGCSEERVKRVSDARSQRLDEFRQGREKQQVLLQLHNEQVKAEAEAEASAAAAAGGGGEAEEKKAPRVQAEEDRNLVLIIKADVQVWPYDTVCMPANWLLQVL